MTTLSRHVLLLEQPLGTTPSFMASPDEKAHGFDKPFLRYLGNPRNTGDQSANLKHFVAATGELVGTFLFLFFAFLGHQMVLLSLHLWDRASARCTCRGRVLPVCQVLQLRGSESGARHSRIRGFEANVVSSTNEGQSRPQVDKDRADTVRSESNYHPGYVVQQA